MADNRWLLLTHQLPNEPSNLRVKVWRKLQSFGAVPIKNSIYVLPNKTSTREDFEWLRKEIVQSGGEATVFVADSIAEKDDKEIVRNFQEARAKDYLAFKDELGAFNEKIKTALDGGHVKDDAFEKLTRAWSAHKSEWERLNKIDFYAAPNKSNAAAALSEGQSFLNRAKAAAVKESPAPPPFVSPKDLKGRVWVTRTSPHIDRLACAWLIRRFIDAKAAFKFVSPPYAARAKELRFDMAEAEFTHFGDWCSFETLIARLRLEDSVLAELAEIIHDIDLKDRKYSRPEASGIALAIRGICRHHPKDEARLKAGIEFFDGVYAALGAQEKR